MPVHQLELPPEYNFETYATGDGAHRQARNTDPEESHEAARRGTEARRAMAERVLSLIARHPGSTAHELGARLAAIDRAPEATVHDREFGDIWSSVEVRWYRHALACSQAANKRCSDLVRDGKVTRGEGRECKITRVAAATYYVKEHEPAETKAEPPPMEQELPLE